ncbi:MAG: Macrolide export ATP-binding/permease protein MacB [Paracidovorax wautersii]|uniref:Pyoverdine export ATP-binding/permease protein PvdT n=1 Tax=Paracidovorax wautersii TaxID=1177982 RepID=A0A7V8FN94_9BURK|nr:MAG: Macrolide export ATP-binding/permease protein MacB [Paracidovorax wautersii]
MSPTDATDTAGMTDTPQAPLLSLRQVRREFPAGEQTIAVLRDIDLDIHAGEMVAIVGASGSGKSTLMNILGCLDKPTRGQYRVAGRETGQLAPDELAELRRGHFGFIFQRYHLLSDLTAQGNVAVPAVYAGVAAPRRQARSQQLLERLGLGDRTGHTPGKLSGGQQQRVSIARALMNGGSVILADEPTGALDSRSGEEVMKILQELHAEGHTIIIVTHDMQVAEHAERIIELSDGVVIADQRRRPRDPAQPRLQPQPPGAVSWLEQRRALWDRFAEAFHMALLAMNAHRLRTFLTMLGIIIGIASVVSVVALGQGSQQKVLENISAIGTNTIDIMPGTGFGDRRASAIRTLVPSDADALAQQSYVAALSPQVSTSVTLRYRNVEASATVAGVGESFDQVKGLKIAQGSWFDPHAVQMRTQVAVIDENTRAALFANNPNPIGEVILLGAVPMRVIGVTAKQDIVGFGNTDSLNIWVPYTTAMGRMVRQDYLRSITVRVADDAPMAAAEQGITQLLATRHGRIDFFVLNSDSIRQTIQSTTQTMTLLISSIAVISLIVGGIGVMNIMLVSVTERTREIGVRMAMGARQSDIQQQFLIEAVLVCLIGGVLGILLALGFGQLFARASSDFALAYSTTAMVSAFLCSTLIGVVFGFLPARRAAQLNPVDALARD